MLTKQTIHTFLHMHKDIYMCIHSVLTRIFYFGVRRTHREAKRGHEGEKRVTI